MKCPRCGSDTTKKTGKVYGQPNQSTEFDQCKGCGCQYNIRKKGIYVADSVDVKLETEKRASGSKIST